MSSPIPNPLDPPDGAARQGWTPLLDAMTQGVMLADAGGRYLELNPAAAEILGMDRETLLSCRLPGPWSTLFDADGVAIPAEDFPGLVALRTGAAERRKTMGWNRADGSALWLEVSAEALPGGGALICFHDVSAMVLAHKTLQISEERHRFLADNAIDVIWTMDLQGRFTYMSPSVERLRGYTPAEVMARPIFDLLPPAYVADVREAFQSGTDCATSGRPFPGFRGEFELQRKDGSSVWTEVTVTSMLDQRGRFIGFLGVTRDIAERKQNEDSLRVSEQKFANIFHLSPDAVDLTHLDTGVQVEVNRNYLKMFGYAREELIGHSTLPGDLGTWVSQENRERHIARLKAHGEDLEFEALLRRKDGSIFMGLLSSSLMEIGGRQYNLSIIRDISERMEAELRILRMNEELEKRVIERTAQLEATNKEMEAFSYSVSHDLRAPLRSIDGFSRALLEDCHDRLDEDGKHYLSRIHLGAQRMSNLIDDLLKLSKTNRSELTVADCDLSRLCQRVAGNLADLNPGRRVEVSIQPGMLVQGDRHLMQVVLENLLGNAWKYTSKCREPRVEVGETGSSRGERTFFIRDNGAGFDMAHAGKLFSAFQRLHPETEFEGTGIGLAIVKRIIERHGGRIWAEAEPGKGAAFFFTFAQPAEP